MSKYIRTKNKIYQVESILRDDGFVKGYNVGEMAFITKDQVIKQAYTIEELCDGFYNEIEDYEFSPAKIFSTFDKAKAQCDLYKSVDKNVRLVGFIKTDNCLKFVAKMNDRGDLELI